MAEGSGASRRQFLRNTLGLAGGLVAGGTAVAEMCGITPAQTEGPFYPLTFITDDSINDLTIIEGHAKHARGEVVHITGRVLDTSCRPIKGALVEIWQAAESGRYNHPSDTSGLELDPDFQNWGEFVTDDDGRYAFRTIVPGHYPADVGWTRPPHVHYKVTRRGFRELVTQMYFTPESFEGAKVQLVRDLNERDLILKEVPNRESVIVRFDKIDSARTVGPLLAYRSGKLVQVGDLVAPAGAKVGNFDVTLRSAR